MPADEQKLNVLYQLGQEVRDRRERLGLTLDDIYDENFIRVDYLEAIEEGDYRNLPDTVYTLGFIRSYLKIIDMDELYPDFSHWLKRGSRPTERRKEIFGQYSPPPPGFKLASRFWVFVVLLLAVVGAVTYVAYSWSRNGIPDVIKMQPQQTSSQQTPPSPEPPAIPAAPAASAPQPAASAAPPAATKTSELEIFATDDCWISVRIGDKTDQLTIKKGTSHKVPLTEMARVTFGRPWDVTVKLNGKDIGSPFTGGAKRTQVNYYNPDGTNGKIEPVVNPRSADANVRNP